MGRREAAIEPRGGAAQRLAQELRQLRRTAGSPSYREMAARVHYSATTLSVAASGRSVPSLPVVLAYVAACGGDADEWRAKWDAAAGSSDATATSIEDVVPSRWRPNRDLIGAAVVIAIVAIAVVYASTVAASSTPTVAPSSTPTVNPSQTSAVLLNATVGADCPASAGTVRVYTVSRPWSVGTRGGWKGDGCAGEYYFESDPAGTNRVEWRAAVPAEAMDCYVSVFVPDSPHAAGQASYELRQWIQGTPTLVDTRVVGQAGHHGDWVGLGPYRITGDLLALEMRSAGSTEDEVTAGVVHLFCGRPGQI
jgi:hypothetical protein